VWKIKSPKKDGTAHCIEFNPKNTCTEWKSWIELKQGAPAWLLGKNQKIVAANEERNWRRDFRFQRKLTQPLFSLLPINTRRVKRPRAASTCDRLRLSSNLVAGKSSMILGICTCWTAARCSWESSANDLALLSRSWLFFMGIFCCRLFLDQSLSV
jgi:hypothetical protein